MQSMSFVRRLLRTVTVLYVCLRGQGTDENKKEQHKNVCINCTCYDPKNNIYNLWPLQNVEDPEIPSFWKTYKDYTYSYSPCKSFTLGPADRSNCRRNVAICRSVANVHYRKLANHEDVIRLEYDDDKKQLQLIYRKVFEWEAKVILKCDPTFEEAKFDIVDVAGDWTFILTHKCACPNACLIDPTHSSVPTTPSDPSDPAHSSPNNALKEEISIPAGAFVCFLAISGFVFWKRRRRGRRHNGNDNQRNDERQHLVRGEAERPPSDNVSFINPIGGGSSEPAKPCDITVSKNKTDFNKLSAPV